ncbi:CaiA Acyl-CoA dehydrogenase [Pyrenophora tritici-repentis]|nr:Acyl-CoA dehydrogenase protein [Pyrenophora tritici-repentis]KAI0586525.1 Acyl-CoA dehydrogenase like protein [Pyrenophora tritici-repentis]KAI0591686.1 Acyl-CoA dehydrogenase like protein [Pyrenophora tritici-repentis]KAI0614352.1 Acyl-CoA dehydrogenase like protein [Pyrenophora tritici-repentis]KAI0626506.1 Acyl-CoA dehydrogenase like protein [Pyrenophora tritici-repentis]
MSTAKPQTNNPLPSIMPPQKIEAFGNLGPWSEPSWYNSLASPYYNDSHKKLRNALRTYIDTNIKPYMLEWEEAGEAPTSERLKWAQTGFCFADIPEPYRPGNVPGPAGIPVGEMDLFHFMIMTDETSRIEGGVGVALGGASVIGAPPISDVANIETTATKSSDGSYYTVNGYKKWITGMPWATHMTTAVRTGGPGASGLSVLVIATNSPGLAHRRIPNSGQKAGGASFVELDNVRVPTANLIGAENAGFPIVMRNFNKERFIMAVGCNRKARTCLSESFAYAHTRRTFGKPLIANQIIASKLATIARYVESHWAWLEQLAYHIQHAELGWQDASIAGQIALAKVHGGRILELANREAQQVFGGAGYQKGGGPGAVVEQISRDLRMQVVGGGSEEIIADLAVRQEGKMARGRGWKL